MVIKLKENLLFRLFNKFWRFLFPHKKTEHEKNVELWNKINYEKNLYLNYKLNNYSTVFDVGGYKGQWASDIFSRFQCKIYIFEPVKKYEEKIKERFMHNDNILSFPFGLSSENKKINISIIEDKSSIFTNYKDTELVEMVKISDFIKNNNIDKIDLIKINIEGGEYDLLEDLINSNNIKKINTLQIQFHSFVPMAKERMDAIKNKLKNTHYCVYSFPFVWENWQIK
jgi:FkbM family methyltransferase